MGANPTVLLQLDDPASPARFVQVDQNNPTEITVTCGQAKHGEDTWYGYFSAYLTSPVPASGNIRVFVLRAVDGGGLPPAEPTTVAYKFVDAWSGINNATMAFADSTSKFGIYANGLHQCAVVVTFDMMSEAEGVKIGQAAMPSVASVLSAIQLLDYNTGDALTLLQDPLFTGDKDWGYDAISNEYSKQNLIGSSQTPQLVLDAYNSTVSNGRAALYFYVRHKNINDTNPITLGLMVSPTGFYLDDEGALNRGTSIIYSGGFKSLSNISTIQPVAPPQLLAGDISSKGTPLTPSNQNDKGPANGASGAEYCENYYRIFNYEVGINTQFMNNYNIRQIKYQISNPDALQDNYCYSIRTSGLYSHMLYLWPNNIDNAKNGNAPPFKMAGNVDYGATATPTTSGNTIAVTRYIWFGALYRNRYYSADVNLLASDEYGNTYPIYLPADTTTPAYNATTLPNWTPMAPGSGSVKAMNLDDPTCSYKISNPDKSLGLGKSVAVSGATSSTPRVIDVLYRTVSCDNTLQSISINYQTTFDTGNPSTSPATSYTMQYDIDPCNMLLMYGDQAYATTLTCISQYLIAMTENWALTIRPYWEGGCMLLGVNAASLASPTLNDVRYAATTNAGSPMAVSPWQADNTAMIFVAGV